MQDRAIAPFATHYIPQIDLSPLSEYNLAHLQLLSGADRFDRTMQLMAAAVSVVAVSELARLFGASRSTQITASVVCATIPSGVLLATTTENDYFAAACGIVLLVLLASFSFEGTWGYRAAAVGAAIGVCYMAKGTVLLMLGPAAAVLFAAVVYREVLSPAAKFTASALMRPAVVVGVGVLAVVGPFLYQVQGLFGSLLGPTSSSLEDAQLSLSGVGANVIRGTAANFDIGNGKSGVETYVSRVVLDGMRHLYALTGISLNDPRFAVGLNWNPLAARNYSVAQRAGDIGANPWHVVLTWLAIVILGVAAVRGAPVRLVLLFGLALGAGVVLFTGIAKWSIYEVRYTLPVLVALSAVIADRAEPLESLDCPGDSCRARRRMLTSAVGWQIGIAHIAVGEWAVFDRVFRWRGLPRPAWRPPHIKH